MMVQFSSLRVLGKYSFEYNSEWMNERLPHNKLQRRRGWLELYGEVQSLRGISSRQREAQFGYPHKHFDSFDSFRINMEQGADQVNLKRAPLCGKLQIHKIT